MKPGKFILDWAFRIVDLYDLQTNKCLIELDKRFIDREELKDKIKKWYKKLQIKEDLECPDVDIYEILKLLESEDK